MSEEYLKERRPEFRRRDRRLRSFGKQADDDLQRAERPEVQEKNLARQEGLVSMLSVPLTVKDKVIGVINCYTSIPHKFTKSEVEVLTTVANPGGYLPSKTPA